MLDALPGTTLPIYPGLGQAPNMLDCIPGGLVDMWNIETENRSEARALYWGLSGMVWGRA